MDGLRFYLFMLLNHGELLNIENSISKQNLKFSVKFIEIPFNFKTTPNPMQEVVSVVHPEMEKATTDAARCRPVAFMDQ